jgi:ATP-dependent protease ClpP protease subunit
MPVPNKEDLLQEIEPAKYKHYEQQVVHKLHHFYLSQQIEEPPHYTDMIHRIHTASPEDVIHIHLNTPGGHLDTGMQIINAMRSTPAHVICSIESEAHSLGTLIFLAADEFVVHDNVMMMFHNYSGGVFGKGHEQAAQLEGTKKWFSSLARKLYIPFLTEEELARLERGEDIYLHSDDIRKRLDRVVNAAKKVERKLKKKSKKTKDKTEES